MAPALLLHHPVFLTRDFSLLRRNFRETRLTVLERFPLKLMNLCLRSLNVFRERVDRDCEFDQSVPKF